MNIIKGAVVVEVTKEEAPLEGAITPRIMKKVVNQRTVVIILTKEDNLEATLEEEIAIEADLAIREEELHSSLANATIIIKWGIP